MPRFLGLLVWLLIDSLLPSFVNMITQKSTYLFEGNPFAVVQLMDSHLVSSSANTLTMFRREGTVKRQSTLPKDAQTGAFVYVRSMLSYEGRLVVGCTRCIMHAFELEGDQLVLRQSTRLSDEPGHSVSAMQQLQDSDYLLTFCGSQLFQVRRSNLSDFLALDRLQQALAGEKVGGLAVSRYNDNLGSFTGLLLDKLFLVDLKQQALLRNYSAALFSQAKGLSYFVDSAFLPDTGALRLMAFIMADGALYTCEYLQDQVFDRKRFFRRDALALVPLPNTDLLLVVFSSGIEFQSVWNRDVSRHFAVQPVVDARPLFRNSLVVTFDNGRAIEYLLDDICPAGCSECAMKDGKQVCSRCQEGLELADGAESCRSECSKNQENPFATLEGCRPACPKGTWSYHGLCRACDKACAACLGPKENHCSACSIGSSVLTKAGECAGSCPDFEYELPDARRCAYCSGGCQVCDAKEPQVCKVCASGFDLNQKTSTCVKQCDPGTYFNPATELCQKCAVGCQTCADNLKTSCGICLRDFVHHNGQCLKECPSGFYEETGSRSCFSCQKNCRQCLRGNECNFCEKGWVRDSETRGCVSECSTEQGKYVQDGLYCNSCKAPCKTCDELACFSCLPGHVLRSGKCWTEARLQQMQRYFRASLLLVTIAVLLALYTCRKMQVLCFRERVAQKVNYSYELAQPVPLQDKSIDLPNRQIDTTVNEERPEEPEDI